MKNVLLTLLGILFLIGCSEDEQSTSESINATSEVAFGIAYESRSNNANENVSTFSKVMVTLKNEADSIIYDREVLDLYHFNEHYFTDNVRLSVGIYTVEEYFILDDNDSILYASPKEGSALARFVNDPLPLEFVVNADEVTQVMPEVLPVKNLTAEDFGYAYFGFKIIETISFEVIVFDKETKAAITANLKIESEGEELHNEALKAKTNIIAVKELEENYELTIGKINYQPQTLTFSPSELKTLIEQNGLVIHLSKNVAALNCNEPISFPDPVLEHVIRRKIGKETGAIFCSDVEQITTLFFSGYFFPVKIKDISGLEYLKNLRGLILSYNDISDLTALYNLAKLKELSIRGNNLTKVQIKELRSKLPNCRIDS